ncbi:MAG: ATP-dependent helicase HrpB [Bacteroidota bacterium]
MQHNLPIYEVIDELKNKLNNASQVILQAPPGAGKSTALPLELINETWLQGKKIIMLEPRRLAARSVAMRMAQVLNQEVGNTVGYRVRFDTCISKNTKIEVVTEGILTRMLQEDNALENYGLIIFDEFHERSLNSDLSFVLCCEAQKILRPDLKILIMSATIQTQEISKLLQNAPIVTSKGKQYPLNFNYNNTTKLGELNTEQIVNTIKQALQKHSGDILVFLPGAFEIQKVNELINTIPQTVIHNLYGDLSFQLQQEAILPNKNGLRKIVLATSIAETSLTIEGVTVVIDSGLARKSKFDFKSGFNKLITESVTKDAADQRAGRAARLSEGYCYRMWPETANHLLKNQNTPEILESDLSNTLLEIYNWGINDIFELNWITPPPLGNVAQAKTILESLQAIENNKITPLGKALLKYPTHPRFANLFESNKNNPQLLSLATDVIAVLEEKDFLDKNTGANIALRIDALRKWRNKEHVNADKRVLERVERLAKQWRSTVKTNIDNTLVDDNEAGKLIALAYPERIAKLVSEKNGQYKLSNGRLAKLNSSDELVHQEYIAVAQLDGGTSEGKIYSAAPLLKTDVLPLATERNIVSYNSETESIRCKTEKAIGAIVLESKSNTLPNKEQIKTIWKEIITEKGIAFLDFSESVLQWQARVISLAKWNTEQIWPDVSDAKLIETLDEWLLPYIENYNKLSDVKNVNYIDLLNTLLSWEQQQTLGELAPTKITVPSSSEIKIHYFSDGKTPELHVRLQEIFGWLQTPKINNNKTALLIHLLSPGYKPVQVTQDLNSFWKNTYIEVRKDLRGRYPKHSWPENPFTAEAVRGVKRKN